MWQQGVRGEGGWGGGGGEGGYGRYQKRGKLSSSFFLSFLRKVGWLAVNLTSVSEFQVEGNENSGNLFTSSILG
jgi:hypothetical protein